MKKSYFNANDLNALLNQTMQETQQIHKEIIQSSKDDYMVQSAVSPQLDKLVQQKNGLSVDYSRVYAQLQKLIQNGNAALQVLGAVDPDVSGVQVATATATLMNAVRNCVAEFTKIHMQHIKFQQSIQLESIKHKNKLEQIEYKTKLIQEAKNKSNNIQDITPSEQNIINSKNTMVPWNSQNIIQFLNYQKNKGK